MENRKMINFLGPIGVGSTQKSVGKILCREMESISEVTVWDPPNEFGWEALGGPIPFEASQKFESKEGGTQVTALQLLACQINLICHPENRNAAELFHAWPVGDEQSGWIISPPKIQITDIDFRRDDA